jgi:hypothetical protein
MEEIQPRNFKEDLENSKNPTIKKEWENIFKKVFGENININWKDDKISQLDFGCDVLIKTKEGRKHSIDIKTRRFTYFNSPSWVLEIVHHRYKDEKKEQKINTKEGWLYCSTADYIFYGTLNEDGLRIIEYCGFSLIPFKLQQFKSELTNLKNIWATTKFDSGLFQLTMCKLVDINFIKENAVDFWYGKIGGNIHDYF